MVSRAAVEAKVRRQAAELARSTHGYVATPAGLAETMLDWPYQALGVPGAPVVLEPSAGDGVLVQAILEADPDAEVWAVEPDPQRAAACAERARGLVGAGRVRETYPPAGPGSVTVVCSTLEDFIQEVADAGPIGLRFDAAVMNPPFSVPGRPRLWVDHFLAVYDLLRPGGRLVSVAPDVDFGRGPAGRSLQDLIDQCGGEDPYNDMDQAAVRAGFPARVRLLWAIAPMHTPDGRPSWLLNPAPGEPVAVAELDVTPYAAAATPVQAYADRFDGDRLRVVRYTGTCVTCARLLWAHDAGGEDASMWVAECLNPADWGQAGPTVGLCIECRSHRDRYERAMELARPYWSTPVGR